MQSIEFDDVYVLMNSMTHLSMGMSGETLLHLENSKINNELLENTNDVRAIVCHVDAEIVKNDDLSTDCDDVRFVVKEQSGEAKRTNFVMRINASESAIENFITRSKIQVS